MNTERQTNALTDAALDRVTGGLTPRPHPFGTPHHHGNGSASSSTVGGYIIYYDINGKVMGYGTRQ